MKITKPFKAATPASITQGFHDGHKGLDMVSWDKNVYGTPLTAPEHCQVIRIVADTYTPDDTTNLKRGYGIYLKGLETGYVHLYWHILPTTPVTTGQYVKRGQIVAYMGNAGNVRAGGVYVPIEDRLKPSKPGTHLHWEMMSSYTPGNKGVLVDPSKYIDWTLTPSYTVADTLKAIAVVLGKISKLIS